jgi:hypothetical protein
MDLGARIEGPYDLKNPEEHQLRHPDVEEGIFHSCFLQLYEWLIFFSAIKKKNDRQELAIPANVALCERAET